MAWCPAPQAAPEFSSAADRAGGLWESRETQVRGRLLPLSANSAASTNNHLWALNPWNLPRLQIKHKVLIISQSIRSPPKARQWSLFTTTDILFTSCMVLTGAVKSTAHLTTLWTGKAAGREPSQLQSISPCGMQMHLGNQTMQRQRRTQADKKKRKRKKRD